MYREGYRTEPPIGVMPQWLWLERETRMFTREVSRDGSGERAAALRQAIARYEDAGCPVPVEWFNELHWHWYRLAPKVPSGFFRRLWWRFKAAAGVEWAVCVMSQVGDLEYHTHLDTRGKYPDHFVELRCERCGKGFKL